MTSLVPVLDRRVPELGLQIVKDRQASGQCVLTGKAAVRPLGVTDKQKGARSVHMLLDKVVLRPLGHKRPSGQWVCRKKASDQWVCCLIK